MLPGEVDEITVEAVGDHVGQNGRCWRALRKLVSGDAERADSYRHLFLEAQRLQHAEHSAAGDRAEIVTQVEVQKIPSSLMCIRVRKRPSLFDEAVGRGTR